MPVGRKSARALAPHLRKRFAGRLPQQVEVMETALAAMVANPGDAQALDTLHLVVHKIAGSAAFFGFPSLSAAAFELESRLFALLESDAPSPTLEFLQTEIRPHFEVLKRSAGDSAERTV